MDTDQAMSGIWYILALVLVGSALIGRGLPLGGFVRMTLLWVAIFVGLLGLFAFARNNGLLPSRWADEQGQGADIRNDSAPAHVPAGRTEGAAIRIPVSADGHYWVEGTINGSPARFLIDSGASITALSVTTAQRAGLNFDLAAPGVPMVTANGRIDAKRSTIGTLAIGPVRAGDIDVVVSPSFGEVNVIGMNLLSRLKSWGVQNSEMILTP